VLRLSLGRIRHYYRTRTRRVTEINHLSCNCPRPELCKALNRHIIGWQWCIWTGYDDNGKPLDPDFCEKYRVSWAKKIGIDANDLRDRFNGGERGVIASTEKEQKELYLTIEQRLGAGVGTELHKLIPGFLEQEGCKCKSFAKKMNIWGPDSCEKNRKHIVQHMVNESKDRALLSWVPDSATRLVANKLLSTAISRTENQHTDPNNKWFCALTTAPRPASTLKACVESLQVAGFEPFIFAEPNSTLLGEELGPFVIHNKEKRGVWFNWLASIEYALENSDANIIMTVQDDSLFHPDSKTFLEEHVLWPDSLTGFVSLYTPKHYNKKPNKKTALRPTGVNRIITRSMWGACALVWPRKVLEALIEHKTCKQWMGAPTKTKTYWEKVKEKRRNEPWRVQNSDTAIGKLMNHMSRTMWFCDPSPVQHFAQTSAINHGDNKGRRNCGRCANWSESLADQIPLQTNGNSLDRFTYDEILIS
jgi:hypothetical protein